MASKKTKFLSSFRKTSRNKIIKKFNEERVCSPDSTRSRRVIRSFRKYISQFVTKKDKKSKNSQLTMFCAIFVKFSTDFVDWNDGKRQQEKHSFSNGLIGETIAVFSNLELALKKTKFQDFSIFIFFSIFVELLTDFMDQVVETDKQGNMSFISRVLSSDKYSS